MNKIRKFLRWFVELNGDDKEDLLIVVAFAGLAAALIFAGCRTVPPPAPTPDATCADACARLDVLGCRPANCLEVCEANYTDDPGLVNEQCIAEAVSCAAVKECGDDEE